VLTVGAAVRITRLQTCGPVIAKRLAQPAALPRARTIDASLYVIDELSDHTFDRIGPVLSVRQDFQRSVNGIVDIDRDLFRQKTGLL
jgi:hypothetical protein